MYPCKTKRCFTLMYNKSCDNVYDMLYLKSVVG